MKPLLNLTEALRHLPRASGIVIHSGAAHPTALGRALAAGGLEGVPVYTLLPMGDLPYATGPARDQLRINTFLPGAGLRRAMDAGAVVAQRCALSEVPGKIASGQIPVGAVLLRTSPPDAQGRMSLGVSVDYMPEAVKAAQVVVAEIDPAMPVTSGGSWIHSSEVDAWVDAIDGLHALAPVAGDSVDDLIAGQVAGLIGDGCVLQLGVGALPDRVLGRVGHLRHLGLHSGIIGDGAMALIATGVIDNSRKEVLPGVSVATMALGTDDFYRFLHRNHQVELHPCSMTHSAQVLGQLSRLRAVNSALQVDLSGQVNAEWVGQRRVSTPGGLPDFARAAASSATGRSIIALRSTDRTGTSTIVPALSSAQPASLSGQHVDYVVTEYGAADLRGKSTLQRRKALVAIAHPDLRGGLAAE